MALVLLIVSGLMIRTFVALQQVNPGFERPEEVQTFRIAVPGGAHRRSGQMARTHEQIAQRLRQVPGVVSVGLSSSITMDGEDNTNPLIVEHVHVPEGEMPPFGASRPSLPATSRRWAIPSWPDATSRGPNLPAQACRHHLREPRA